MGPNSYGRKSSEYQRNYAWTPRHDAIAAHSRNVDIHAAKRDALCGQVVFDWISDSQEQTDSEMKSISDNEAAEEHVVVSPPSSPLRQQIQRSRGTQTPERLQKSAGIRQEVWRGDNHYENDDCDCDGILLLPSQKCSKWSCHHHHHTKQSLSHEMALSPTSKRRLDVARQLVLSERNRNSKHSSRKADRAANIEYSQKRHFKANHISELLGSPCRRSHIAVTGSEVPEGLEPSQSPSHIPRPVTPASTAAALQMEKLEGHISSSMSSESSEYRTDEPVLKLEEGKETNSVRKSLFGGTPTPIFADEAPFERKFSDLVVTAKRIIPPSTLCKQQNFKEKRDFKSDGSEDAFSKDESDLIVEHQSRHPRPFHLYGWAHQQVADEPAFQSHNAAVPGKELHSYTMSRPYRAAKYDATRRQRVIDRITSRSLANMKKEELYNRVSQNKAGVRSKKKNKHSSKKQVEGTTIAEATIDEDPWLTEYHRNFHIWDIPQRTDAESKRTPHDPLLVPVCTDRDNDPMLNRHEPIHRRHYNYDRYLSGS